MAIEGSLDLFQLPEILQVVAAQDKTGILTVQGENDIVAISFKDGQVVAADALNQTVEDGLGQVLASQGLVSPADFAVVTQEFESSGERLLDLLVSKGLLDRAQLLEALRTQTYQLLLQLLLWQEGEFKFYSGDEVAYEEGFYSISVEELLIRSVTDLGEDGQIEGQLPDLKNTYERVPDGPILKVVGVDGNPELGKDGVKGNEVWLEPYACDFFDRLDGKTRARDLAKEASLDDYKVLFSLYQLLGAGAARLVTKVEAPAQSVDEVDLGGGFDVDSEVEGLGSSVLDFGDEGESLISAPLAEAALPPVIMPDPAEMESYGVPGAPPKKAKKKRKARQKTRSEVSLSWLPKELGALASQAVACLILMFTLFSWWTTPRQLLLPFSETREASLLENQRRAQLQRIDRSARTFFLLEGHYPDELSELVDIGLLPERALRDPEGRAIAYFADDVSYELQPVEKGQAIAELAVREAITGDFLLDAEFLEDPEIEERAPLVLLD